jgi:hypothetical protein
MPVPLAAPVIMTVGRAIIAGGARHAAKKYGDDVVKQVQKSDAFKELKGQIIESRKLSAKKSANNKRFKSKENTVQDNPLLKKRAEERVLDLDNPPIEEIPLRFDMYDGGLLSDDNSRYGMLSGGQSKLDMNNSGDLDAQDFEMLRDQKSIGGLVTKLFKLAKKKKPKEVKEQDIDDILNSLSDEQMEKLTPVEIEQLLDMDLAKSGVDNIPAKSTKKDIDDILDNLTDKEIENLTPIEREQLLDMEIEKYGIKGRKTKTDGGLLSDDRQAYGVGSLVKKLIKKKPSKQASDIKYAEDEIDGLIDLRRKRKAQLEDDLKEATQSEKVKLLKDYNDSLKEITQEINRYNDQLRELGVKPSRKNYEEKIRTSKADGGMLPDEDMENNYTRFIMDEALTEDEEDMLVSKLEQDEELAMLFDKVIDVAQEFAGAGPVEGPGSGVSDSIPARLSDGEFVFTAKAVEEIGADNLMAMMKDAEAKADERQPAYGGGTITTMENNNKGSILDTRKPIEEEQQLNYTNPLEQPPIYGSGLKR